MKETGAASAFLPARKLAAFLGRTPTPLFLYDEKSLVQTARTLFAYFAWEPGFLPLFPVRMNRNPAILRLLCSVGCGAVCQTAEELRLAAVCGFSGSRLRYLPALPDAEAEQLAHTLGAVFVLTVIVLLSFSLLHERRRKREALRNLLYEHETLCLAIEGNSTYAWRLEGDSVSCDSQFCELIHHRSGRLLLNEITPYIHPDDLPAFRKNIAARRERTHHKGQYRCNFTGEFQWWEFSYNTIHTPGHAPIIAGLLQNIQELKDHEQELIESRELAEQAELKQSFLNNMSHEIRTPLNAIVGFSDMLANEPEFSDEERQEFVDIINTNTKLLLKLVGDVLELSRIESGNLSFIFQRESVRQLLDDVYQTHSLLIQPPLQFLKDFPPEDVQVNVDPMRLTQVLTNFLNNANKFTKEGSIQLGYCCPSGMSEVHLYVEDTGIGIPHSEQKIIFERFYKRSEFSQGVGLGLSICVLIVEKMGGRIELRSEEGRGSRFTVVLPCIE